MVLLIRFGLVLHWVSSDKRAGMCVHFFPPMSQQSRGPEI